MWRRLTAGAGRLAGRRADRGRAGPGPPPGRGRAAAVAVRPAARPGRRRATTGAWWRGLLVVRTRRHHPDRARHPGRPGRVHQAGRQPRRDRLPAAAPAGPGGLRHPHPHRRGVRPHHDGRDHLRPAAAAQPARRDDPAGRPQLRRPDLLADIAATGAESWSGSRTAAGCPSCAAYRDGSYLSMLGHTAGPRHRLRDHHHHHRRTTHRPLPAGHHPARPPTATRPPS